MPALSFNAMFTGRSLRVDWIERGGRGEEGDKGEEGEEGEEEYATMSWLSEDVEGERGKVCKMCRLSAIDCRGVGYRLSRVGCRPVRLTDVGGRLS